jgi:hypothetical protein
MERSTGDLDLGIAVLHTRVLRARLRRGWRRIRLGVGIILTLGVVAGIIETLAPFWRGYGWVQVAAAAPDLAVQLRGQVIPAGSAAPVVAGTHPVRVEQGGQYPWEGTITVSAGMTVTLTAPASWPRAAAIRRVAVPGRGMPWETVVTARRWWRLASGAPPGGAVAHVDARRTTRLPALDRVEVGDVMDGPSGNVWIEWTPHAHDAERGMLRVALPGRSVLTRAMERVTRIVWRPDGEVALLVHPRGRAPGVVFWDVVRAPEPGPVVATVGGDLIGVHWHPDGWAALLIGQAPPDPVTAAPRCDALLLQWDPRPAAGVPPPVQDRPQVTVLSSPAHCPMGLAPFAWDPHGVWWTTRMDDDGVRLEYWPFDGSGPWEMGRLTGAPVALRVDAQGTLWIADRADDGALRLRPWPPRAEAVLVDDAPRLDAGAAGVWNEVGLLLTDGRATVWVIGLTPPPPARPAAGAGGEAWMESGSSR